eukprot:TRINITY_DN7194_c0_g1_i2.p1 TRINITY_DN7194_c0_g1~~TRINITY_DN7194_c0_g1_i2.p1  ORF type:complete len:430 (+),score=68.16 TRINITY_DN7194_c0_g1_i2:142-1431(+)
MADALWNALNLAHQVASYIEAQPLDIEHITEPDVLEVKQTIARARSCLLPFLSASITNPVFDVCVLGIRDSLKALSDVVVGSGAEPGVAVSALSSERNCMQRSGPRDVALPFLRSDFLLSQRCDQFLALFPGVGKSSSAEQLIADRSGRALWMTSFGNMSLMVPWSSFQTTFESFLSVRFGDQEDVAKAFIDFTQDGFVTPYELNAFLRWFGPLHGSFLRLLDLYNKGVLGGFIPAFEANKLLAGEEPGTFLVRFSKTSAGAFALAFVDRAGDTRHCLLYTKGDSPHSIFLHGVKREFESLDEFLTQSASKLRTPRCVCWLGDHQNNSGRGTIDSSPSSSSSSSSSSSASRLGSGGQEPSIRSEPSGSSPGEEVTPGEPELCVVCMDQGVNTVFLECGHLACCKECSEKVRKCPVCRQNIVRVLPVYRA